jgi:hypothetical protein
MGIRVTSKQLCGAPLVDLAGINDSDPFFRKSQLVLSVESYDGANSCATIASCLKREMIRSPLNVSVSFS